MAIELLSVHFPKAAGSSFLRSLQGAYGATAIYHDCADDPVNPCSPFNLDPEGCLRKAQATIYEDSIRVIHGHFHPSKYAHLSGVKRVTFLRHPLNNLLSIYFYWKTLAGGNALVQYVRENDLGILEFARLPTIRYLLSRTFFGNVDLKTFDFIGTMANYRADIQKLSTILGVPLHDATLNVTEYPAYLSARQSILTDSLLVEQLREILAEDIDLYHQVVQSSGR